MTTVADFGLGPGVVLAGKYRVERILGQGGMGVVAAVQHIQLEQRMALKLMLPQVMGNAEAVSRFLREARAAARITSEHVARVFDVGSLATGEPYIAMEYLEGADIAQLLATRGRLTVEESIDYLLQAGEALAEAHAAGIVHRDLKPANLFLVQRVDGQQLVKVLDFGISKMRGGAAASNGPATQTSALMGSPLYMSPEQMDSSKNVDARSDLWALGVVLYEMLSGTAPFDGETLPQVCAMVMTQRPAPLADRAPDLPPLLFEVVHRCLEKQPAARFQSIAELAHALGPLASQRATQSIERIARVQGVLRVAQPPHSVQAVTSPAPGAAAGTYAPWGDTNPPPVARRRGPMIAGVAAVALGVAGAGAWLSSHPASMNLSAAVLSSGLPSSPVQVTATAPPASEAVAPLAVEPAQPTAPPERAAAPQPSSSPSITPKTNGARAVSGRPVRASSKAAGALAAAPTVAKAAPAAPAAPSPARPASVAPAVAPPPTRSRL